MITTDLTQKNDGTTYVPFSDGIIYQTQGYYVTPNYTVEQNDFNTQFIESFFNGDNERKLHKCEYCGKPDYHANCHGHEKWCPKYCGGNELSLGSDIFILSGLIIVYTLYKKLFNK